MNELKHFWYWLTEARKQPSGLLPLKKDSRDLDIQAVLGGWFGAYTPQASSKRLIPTFTKNQLSRSNCSFQSGSNACAIAVAQALSIEVGEAISARYLTAKAFQQGLCGVNGWADLRAILKVAQKWGCCTEAECPPDENLSWNNYVGIALLKYDELAKTRKINSYYSVKNTDDYLRAIDAGHAVCLGRTWLSGMNQGGGFSYPWILPRKGYAVGGHATCGVGYNVNYQGIKVSDELNSYGEDWGDSGHFYTPLTDLQNDINSFGAYAITDLVYSPKITSQEIIERYEGKNVRGDKSGAIYLIYDSQKFTYTSAEAFVAVNGYAYTQKGSFALVPQDSIDSVPYYGGSYSESLLDGRNGKHADVVANMKKPINDNFNPNIEISQ